MKKTAPPKILIFVTILFAFYILAVYFTSSAAGLNQPAYTVFSAREDGMSLLFDTLKHLNYPVDISYEKITGGTGRQNVQIVAYPEPYYFTDTDESEMLEWVEAGGFAIYFGQTDFFSPIRSGSPLGRELETHGPFTLYDYGYGQIVVCAGETVTNRGLLENGEYGGIVCNILDNWDYDRIYFNEYYHGFQQNPTVWKNIPFNFKLIVYQLVLTVLIILWYFGKRFGRPVPYYEEIEREENEYLKALSTLYQKAGMGDAAVESYYNDFLRRCCNFFNKSLGDVRENILLYWKQEHLKRYDLLAETINEIESGESYKRLKNQRGRRKFLRTIKNIKKLSDEVSRPAAAKRAE